MQPTIVYVCRHGQVDNPDHVLYGRLPGYGLSALGHAMAERLGEHFADVPLQHLRVSPLQRAKETLAPIAAGHPDLEIVEQGSSYKFCLLAEGRVDYYVRTTHTYEWDTAAGELILAEAGGRTRTLPDDGVLRYNEKDLRNPWFVCRSKYCVI